MILTGFIMSYEKLRHKITDLDDNYNYTIVKFTETEAQVIVSKKNIHSLNYYITPGTEIFFIFASYNMHLESIGPESNKDELYLNFIKN